MPLSPEDLVICIGSPFPRGLKPRLLTGLG